MWRWIERTHFSVLGTVVFTAWPARHGCANAIMMETSGVQVCRFLAEVVVL